MNGPLPPNVPLLTSYVSFDAGIDADLLRRPWITKDLDDDLRSCRRASVECQQWVDPLHILRAGAWGVRATCHRCGEDHDSRRLVARTDRQDTPHLLPAAPATERDRDVPVAAQYANRLHEVHSRGTLFRMSAVWHRQPPLAVLVRSPVRQPAVTDPDDGRNGAVSPSDVLITGNSPGGPGGGTAGGEPSPLSWTGCRGSLVTTALIVLTVVLALVYIASDRAARRGKAVG